MASGLVAKLRKQPGVRNPEALAAWLGRYKQLRQAGIPNKKAAKLAGKPGGMEEAENSDVGGLQPASDADRKKLGVPPAWTDVKIDNSEGAALLAVGKDSKGRDQRIYSAEHHERQAAQKFERVSALHSKIDGIDSKLSKDAKDDDTALAALMVRRMGLRPGSDRNTGAEKQAYGATNLKSGDVSVNGDTVNAKFTGKKGVDLDLSLEDPELAGLIKGRQSDGRERLLNTDERKLRNYMSGAAPGFKPKDFRTYIGTTTALEIVESMPKPKNKKEYKSQRREVGKRVSEILGNTPTIALNSYIAPSAFGSWDSELAGK